MNDRESQVRISSQKEEEEQEANLCHKEKGTQKEQRTKVQRYNVKAAQLHRFKDKRKTYAIQENNTKRAKNKSAEKQRISSTRLHIKQFKRTCNSKNTTTGSHTIIYNESASSSLKVPGYK